MVDITCSVFKKVNNVSKMNKQIKKLEFSATESEFYDSEFVISEFNVVFYMKNIRQANMY